MKLQSPQAQRECREKLLARKGWKLEGNWKQGFLVQEINNNKDKMGLQTWQE